MLAELAAIDTAEDRARAATALIAQVEEVKRAIARARIPPVVELLRAGWSLPRLGHALELSANAIVQIRDEHLGRPRRRPPA